MSPPAITSNDKSICRLCGRQFAKYNCPTCNVAYCSLTCFRSEAHSQCSETFYKKEVEADIRSAPSKTTEERMKMMELLKKFEEENQESTGLEDDDDDGEDLAHRLEGLDLDSVSSADLWSKLTPAEQAEFLKIMGDSNSDLAKKLLASQELENEQCEPWWDTHELEVDDPISYQYGPKPDMILVPAKMMKPIFNGPPLFYNVCAVCIAYAFITRHLSISPLSSLTPENIDFEESKCLLSQLVPFLTDRKSTTLYPNLSSLVTDIWSRFKPAQVNSGLFAVLLKDAARLLRPLPVTSVSTSPPLGDHFDPTNHPHSNAVLALSDLTKLFEGTAKGVKKSHVTQKLLFYAAHILSTPSEILRAVTEELVERSMAYQVTTDGDHSVVEASSERDANRRKEPGRRVPLIEEI